MLLHLSHTTQILGTSPFCEAQKDDTYPPGSYQLPSFVRTLPALSSICSSASTGGLLLAPFHQDRVSSERNAGSVRPQLPCAKPSLCQFQPVPAKLQLSSTSASNVPVFYLPLALTSTPRHLSSLRSSCLTQPFTDNSGTTITTTHWKFDIFFSPLLPTSTEQNVFWEPGHKAYSLSLTDVTTLPSSGGTHSL